MVNCDNKVNFLEKFIVLFECLGNVCNVKLIYFWFLLYLELDEGIKLVWKINSLLMNLCYILLYGSFLIIVIKKNVL